MSTPGGVGEVAAVFLRLGAVAFGGPAAHIAMMREELVRRRGWVDDQRFLDLVGATNLVPGPNSTELAIHLGYDRARWRGLVVAGVCFIVPAALMVAGLAWAYVEYGETPAVESLLYGVVPAVIAIVLHALTGLLRTVAKRAWPAVLAAAALTAYLLGVHELLVLAAGAMLPALVRAGRALARGGAAQLVALPVLVATGRPTLGDPSGGQLAELFWTMLKIGSVLYGSGYVLLTFLEGDFVDRLGWLSHQQLVDAVSVGQVTPGPVFTTATFVGYVVAGPVGAGLATVAIFLPSFAFVGLLTKITDKLRSSPWTAVMLDGLNAAAFALMAGVTLELGRAAFVDGWTVAIGLVALLLLLRTRLNSAWLVLGGGAVGLLVGLL
ncbi:chromate efflux transporter [Nocardioides ferulae]|uniref:chromate efflux transporter n=1 Tax=Nocardioides ferulae TaxID=2340821 RepID=UPI000EADECE6|nr:chromate efflux transporter [Nocardioides ferulae]